MHEVHDQCLGTVPHMNLSRQLLFIFLCDSVLDVPISIQCAWVWMCRNTSMVYQDFLET